MREELLHLKQQLREGCIDAATHCRPPSVASSLLCGLRSRSLVGLHAWIRVRMTIFTSILPGPERTCISTARITAHRLTACASG